MHVRVVWREGLGGSSKHLVDGGVQLVALDHSQELLGHGNLGL
jgi:hypothetical protein